MNVKTSLNRIFSVNEQIDYIKDSRGNIIEKEKIEQYKEVIQKNDEYPNVESNRQFRIIIDSYTQHHHSDYILRLIQIIQYVLRKENVLSLLNKFLERKQFDKGYYKMIKEFSKHERGLKTPKRYINQPDFIHFELMNMVLKDNGIKINSLFDVGCGNGRKSEEIGKLFNISPSNIICADIEKWFDYNDYKRKKRELKLLSISESGEIKYDGDTVDLITIIHSIHHWCYSNADEYIVRMKSLNKILKKNGYVAVIEHDVITEEDACLVDIEHGLFEVVISNNENGFYKDYKSKYLNFIELEIIMKKSGFNLILFKYYDGGFIDKQIIPDKSYLAIFKRN